MAIPGRVVSLGGFLTPRVLLGTNLIGFLVTISRGELMQNVRIGFTVTVLVILGLGFVVSAGSAAGQGNQDQASRIQQKIERLHGLVQQRQ